MYTDLSLFPESLARILLWFISGFLERDLIDGHMALHNTNLYGTLIRSYSLGCCYQSSVEASGLNLFILFKGGYVCHLGHCKVGILLLFVAWPFGLVNICCHLGHCTAGK